MKFYIVLDGVGLKLYLYFSKPLIAKKAILDICVI